MLNQKVYEALRWIIAIVIPAFSVLLATLTKAWAWDIPLDAILTTMDGVALFLGAVFGISKLNYDKAAEDAERFNAEVKGRKTIK